MIGAVLVSSCVHPGPSPAGDPQAKTELMEIANYPASRGSIFYQASNNDHFDYRKPLKRAMEGDAEALATLFRYSHTGTLLGEGAMTHMDVLRELLKLWGDKPYADVLKKQPLSVRESVGSWLNESWGPVGEWPEDRFPITRSLRKSAYETYIEFPDLNRAFVPDAGPSVASEKMDIPGIASTLPIFEVAPAMRHDWIYRDGIVEQSDSSIQYRSDGAGPAPYITLLRKTDPIRIEVTSPGSNRSTAYQFERAPNGWNRLKTPRSST
jgi:hypothetical protein